MTSIEWTDQTWNPVVGCTPVSPGCLNCYAADQAPRLGAMGQKRYIGLTVRRTDAGGAKRDVFNGTIRLVPEQLDKPLKRKKPTRYFIASMSDLFHEDVPFEFIDRVFAVMALCPQHTFQVLTKRPERMAGYLSRKVDRCDAITREMLMLDGAGHDLPAWPLPNVWLGTSAEDQTRLEERVPHLLRCPAAVRYLSCEPLLSGLDLQLGVWQPATPTARRNHLDWIIVGGESGDQARPCRLEWIRGVVAQCRSAGVPVFVKQLGARPIGRGVCDCGRVEHGRCHSACPSVTGVEISLHDVKGGEPAEWPDDLRVREMPTGVVA